MKAILSACYQRVLPMILVLMVLPLAAPNLGSVQAQQRPLELTDIMQFREIQQRVQTDDLRVIAFSANPDFGDREGQVVRSSDGTVWTVERGMRPQITAQGDYVVFLQEPALLDRERASTRDERRALVQNAVLVNTATGEQTVRAKPSELP
ncbi:MAG: hypothetical protein M1356_00020 [Gammaproteobacteria bacterium]|nr:hypothetical protein [Gammaproteobacteria bacterium]